MQHTFNTLVVNATCMQYTCRMHSLYMPHTLQQHYVMVHATQIATQVATQIATQVATQGSEMAQQLEQARLELIDEQEQAT